MPRAAIRELATGASKPSYYNRRQDIEAGKMIPKARFRDAVHKVVRDGRRDKLKKQLLEGMERYHFEDYRKSDEDLKMIKTKKVRDFYERQNDCLDSWLEVDMVVRSVADDILYVNGTLE